MDEIPLPVELLSRVVENLTDYADVRNAVLSVDPEFFGRGFPNGDGKPDRVEPSKQSEKTRFAETLAASVRRLDKNTTGAALTPGEVSRFPRLATCLAPVSLEYHDLIGPARTLPDEVVVSITCPGQYYDGMSHDEHHMSLVSSATETFLRYFVARRTRWRVHFLFSDYIMGEVGYGSDFFSFVQGYDPEFDDGDFEPCIYGLRYLLKNKKPDTAVKTLVVDTLTVSLVETFPETEEVVLHLLPGYRFGSVLSRLSGLKKLKKLTVYQSGPAKVDGLSCSPEFRLFLERRVLPDGFSLESCRNITVFDSEVRQS